LKERWRSVLNIVCGWKGNLIIWVVVACKRRLIIGLIFIIFYVIMNCLCSAEYKKSPWKMVGRGRGNKKVVGKWSHVFVLSGFLINCVALNHSFFLNIFIFFPPVKHSFTLLGHLSLPPLFLHKYTLFRLVGSNYSLT